MIYKEQLDSLVDEYQKTLNQDQINSYIPPLRDAFMVYLLDKYSDRKDIEHLFTHTISGDVITYAGANYINNTNKVFSVGAIDKYLTVIGEFYKKIIIPKYPKSILKDKNDFHDLTDAIRDLSNKDLLPKNSHTQINEQGYKVFLDYLNSLNENAYKQQVIKAVFKLILLYGFKIGIISNFKKADFDENKRTLVIREEETNNTITLELPYNLSRIINKVKNSNNIGSEYLFLTESGQQIDSDYFDYTLKIISKEIPSKQSKKFTTTGLAKYAVINMFLEGINPITVSRISGMKDVHLRYCQQEAYKSQMNNRYINAKIRAISTFEDFNF